MVGEGWAVRTLSLQNVLGGRDSRDGVKCHHVVQYVLPYQQISHRDIDKRPQVAGQSRTIDRERVWESCGAHYQAVSRLD